MRRAYLELMDFIGIVGAWALEGFAVMVAFQLLHHDAPAVPAFGYFASVMAVVAINLMVNGMVDANRGND